MRRAFATLADGLPPPEITPVPCQVCGGRASFRRRQNPMGRIDRPVYSEAYCGDHVPASWLPGRAV